MLLAGISLTLAFAPFSIWPLTFPAMALAIRQLRQCKNSFLSGWLFGLGWFGAGISWVHVSIADFGGMPIVASVGIMALLCSYLALYPALAFWINKKYFVSSLWPLTLPFLWMFSEWLRSWVLSGFPWLSLGYSQIDSPLHGLFPLIGETGISALIVMLAAALAVWLNARQWKAVAVLTVVIFSFAAVLQNIQWTKTGHTWKVAMVQGNIAQSIRWTPDHDVPTMEKYEKLTRSLWDNDLIIWPEAAIPKLEFLAQGFLNAMDARAFDNNSALITGIVNYNWESEEAWNSLLVLGKKQPNDSAAQYRYSHTNRYSKHHLLPVGEFVPFEDLLRPLAPLFDLPMSSFSRGDYQQTNLLANGIRLAPAICFEIAFPRQVSANVHADTDMIITVSNDAWFGHSHGPAQHLEIARVRALEFGRPVLRATNNGITAFINAEGNVISRLPQFEAGSLEAPVTGRSGLTPYKKFGDIPFYILTFMLFTYAAIRQRNAYAA